MAIPDTPNVKKPNNFLLDVKIDNICYISLAFVFLL